MSSFTASFATSSAKRNFEARQGDPTLVYCKSPRVAKGSRRDISMKRQVCLAHQRDASAHAAWVSEHSAILERTPDEEKHFLRVLIRTAVLRQRENESDALSRVILSRTQAPGAIQKKNVVTAAEAHDLDFVVKKLMEDIDIVHARHGYNVTLQTFSQLSPWQL